MIKPILRLDKSVTDAIKLYFLYGLRPGSFTTLIITGNPKDAEYCAHPGIKDCIVDHVTYINRVLPPICLGQENFDNWRGYYSKYNEADKVFLKLMMNPILEKWVKEANDAKFIR